MNIELSLAHSIVSVDLLKYSWSYIVKIKVIAPLVLVGFGKDDLKDLIKKVGTLEEETLIRACLNAPPRYRREEICSEEEVAAFLTFGKLLQETFKGEN